MNKIILTGNLTADPERRSTPNGISVCSFTIAVNKKFTKDGDTAQFFRIHAWRQLGDLCAKYLSKGRKIAVIGELEGRTYEGKDGRTRISLEVTADEIEFLSPKGESEKPVEQMTSNDLENVNLDDIPWI